jgi:hypothetical protein
MANILKKCDQNIGIYKKRQFVCRNLQKNAKNCDHNNAENCDHNIDPCLEEQIKKTLDLENVTKIKTNINFRPKICQLVPIWSPC